MPNPTFAQAVRLIAEKTGGGVKRARIASTVGDSAAVQFSSSVTGSVSTTDEPLFPGDSVWVQPIVGRGGTIVAIHGRA